MATSSPTQTSDSLEYKKQEDQANTTTTCNQQDVNLIIPTLPREKGWITEHLYHYQGFWYPAGVLQGITTVQQQIKAQPTHVFLVSYPKSGTTWFKALLFAIINRTRFDFHTNPLLTSNPHECVPFFEKYIIDHPNSTGDLPLLATHSPFSSLPESLIVSGCRMVYVFRDPKDTFVSLWHYTSKLRLKELPPLPIEEAFELFCKGASPFGPYWDHVLGYWKANIEWPDRVLFMKYEDMKSEPFIHVKILAEFSGYPFSLEEENEGVVQKIIDLCSFESLSSLEVNKSGTHSTIIPTIVHNNAYFRQGKVGDWKNCLTTEMAEQMDEITKMKFKELFVSHGSSLTSTAE